MHKAVALHRARNASSEATSRADANSATWPVESSGEPSGPNTTCRFSNAIDYRPPYLANHDFAYRSYLRAGRYTNNKLLPQTATRYENRERETDGEEEVDELADDDDDVEPHRRYVPEVSGYDLALRRDMGISALKSFNWYSDEDASETDSNASYYDDHRPRAVVSDIRNSKPSDDQKPLKDGLAREREREHKKELKRERERDLDCSYTSDIHPTLSSVRILRAPPVAPPPKLSTAGSSDSYGSQHKQEAHDNHRPRESQRRQDLEARRRQELDAQRRQEINAQRRQELEARHRQELQAQRKDARRREERLQRRQERHEALLRQEAHEAQLRQEAYDAQRRQEKRDAQRRQERHEAQRRERYEAQRRQERHEAQCGQETSGISTRSRTEKSKPIALSRPVRQVRTRESLPVTAPPAPKRKRLSTPSASSTSTQTASKPIIRARIGGNGGRSGYKRKEYKCDICVNFYTGSKGDLKRHMESKLHKKPSYICYFHPCEKVFTRDDALKRHMKNAHDHPPNDETGTPVKSEPYVYVL